ncbi:MAG: PAS domain-containing protein [Geminicoccales bacterium]
MGHPIQIILARQLATQLSVPVFLVDPEGTLLFYNEPAETVLGRRFDDTGEMPAEDWSSMFLPVDDQGELIPPNDLPLMVTLKTHQPAHKHFTIKGLDGAARKIGVTSIPFSGLKGEFLGAAALFWELPP